MKTYGDDEVCNSELFVEGERKALEGRLLSLLSWPRCRLMYAIPNRPDRSPDALRTTHARGSNPRRTGRYAGDGPTCWR
jgi:hypothetical protein